MEKGFGQSKNIMFGPLHEKAEYQVIVYSYTKLTLLTVLLALPHHLSYLKKFSVQKNFQAGLNHEYPVNTLTQDTHWLQHLHVNV